jgi:arylsulfatase A-like enzyme
VPPPAAADLSSASEATRTADERNLVLITIDTLRASEMGFLGYDKPTTPNLDALASRSVVFERAYAMASYTGKALGPMLIGKYPSETLRDGGHFNRYFGGNTFLAERLKGAGIFTMGAASNGYFRDWSGMTQGFTVFDLSATPPASEGDTDANATSAELTSAALKLLAAHAAGQRFFLWVHYFDPHLQYVPHSEAPNFLDPSNTSSRSRMRALYDGEVWFTDKYIGDLLEAIASAPWGEKTIIAVTSDHGESMDEHGMGFQHGFEIWEPLVHVPLILSVPGARPHRVPVKRSVIDLVPTLLDLMGMAGTGTGELSGQTLIPDIEASSDEDYEERDVYFDMPDGPYTHMRRGILHGPTPGMKLIDFGASQVQVYDLRTDPEETEDLSSHPEILAPLLEAMRTKRATLHEILVKADAPTLP